jgi:death-on-curing protein
LKLLEPQTLIAMNRLTIRLHGGLFLPPDNLRAGQGLGFAEQIRINRLFGKVLYPGPYHQAAAYLYYIVKNHSFNDGNKRTGLAAALTVLEWNGLSYRSFSVREGEAFVNSVATSKLDPGEEIQRIASWLEPRPSKPLPRRRR